MLNATVSTPCPAAAQPFGSALRNLWRQASLTHELKLPLPAAPFICSKSSSSKRMCFIVLPERSNGFFSLLSCIGNYRSYNELVNGNYHLRIYQAIKTARPGSGGTLTGPLTNNVTETNAMAKPQCNQTHPKYQYRFMALDRADSQAKPCKIIVEATSEHEARKVLAAHYILSLAAVLPVQEVRHA